MHERNTKRYKKERFMIIAHTYWLAKAKQNAEGERVDLIRYYFFFWPNIDAKSANLLQNNYFYCLAEIVWWHKTIVLKIQNVKILKSHIPAQGTINTMSMVDSFQA